MKPILFFIFGALLLIVGVVLHEVTHGQIMEYYDVPYEYVILEGNSFAAVKYNGGDCNDTCLLAHSMNEIVGYTIMPFLISIIMILIIRIK